MKYTDEQLDKAIENDIFTAEQVNEFRLSVQNSDKKATKYEKTLYYVGALLIMSAMTWLMFDVWDRFDAAGLVVMSSVYFVAFLVAGYYVFFVKKLETAGGLLFTVSIAVTPLFVYSVMELMDIWHWGVFNGIFAWRQVRWMIIQVSTVLVALVILKKVKFPFHVLPISVALFFFSMSLGYELRGTWEQQTFIFRTFGICMIAVGYFTDLKFKKDYSFWLYLFGAMTLLIGLSGFSNNDIFGFIRLGFASVIMILFSLFINRNVILVFGGLGIIILLGRLASLLFDYTIFFILTLTVIGVSLIVAGIFLQKNRKYIEENIVSNLPETLLKLRPKIKA